MKKPQFIMLQVALIGGALLLLMIPSCNNRLSTRLGNIEIRVFEDYHGLTDSSLVVEFLDQTSGIKKGPFYLGSQARKCHFGEVILGDSVLLIVDQDEVNSVAICCDTETGDVWPNWSLEPNARKVLKANLEEKIRRLSANPGYELRDYR